MASVRELGAPGIGVALRVTVGVGVSVSVALQMSRCRCDRGLPDGSRGRAGRAEAAE